MVVRGITLLLLCLSMAALAKQEDELITNLRSRIVHFSGEVAFIKSFPERSQSYIYDQALAIIAFTKAGEKDPAAKLLRGLSSVQKKDGSLHFSYVLDGHSPYPAEGNRRFAGAIAWVALATVHYQSQFKSEEFITFNLKFLSWLRKEMSGGALRFSPVDLPSTKWKENETAALEHNLDAYAAFSHFAMLNPQHPFTQEISSLKKFILSMWDEGRSHFWSGKNIRTGSINKDELYLDNQSWSVLALDPGTLKMVDVKAALEFNCESLYAEHDGVSGFMDSKPANGPRRFEFVWSEGTLGQVLAMKQANFSCGKKTAQVFLTEMVKMKKEDGGIAYATSAENPDFTTSSSVAGTAWMYFAVSGVNPFRVIQDRSIASQSGKISHHVP